jgi:hypothetical protein
VSPVSRDIFSINNISGAESFIEGIGVRPNLLDLHPQSSAFLELLNYN